MSNAKQEEEWGRLAQLSATIANIHRGKRKPYKADDFNPFKQVRAMASIQDLRIFIP